MIPICRRVSVDEIRGGVLSSVDLAHGSEDRFSLLSMPVSGQSGCSNFARQFAKVKPIRIGLEELNSQQTVMIGRPLGGLYTEPLVQPAIYSFLADTLCSDMA
ncbi:MAG: hypothetical protein O3A00_24575, partial [Planctomycetota bacterium]|nr:hypothetical protein [Planctomycetota bacterium]